MPDAGLDRLYGRGQLGARPGEEVPAIVDELGQRPAGAGLPAELFQQGLLPVGIVEVHPDLKGEVVGSEVVDGIIARPGGVLFAVVVQVQRLAHEAGGKTDPAVQDKVGVRGRQIGPVAVEGPIADQPVRKARVVVHVGHQDILRVEPRVERVAANCRVKDDGVRHIEILVLVVDAGHGDRLRHIPIGRGEGEGETCRWRTAAGGDQPLGGVAGPHADCHLRRRLRVEHHGERGRPAAFRGREPLNWAGGNARRVAVHVDGRNGRRLAVIVRVGAGGGKGDPVKDIAIVDKVVEARDGDRPRLVPVGRCEHQAGRREGGLVGGLRRGDGQGHGHVGRRLRIQTHGERIGRSFFGGQRGLIDQDARRGSGLACFDLEDVLAFGGIGQGGIRREDLDVVVGACPDGRNGVAQQGVAAVAGRVVVGGHQ